MTTFKAVYPADSVVITATGMGGLASSATGVAGVELGPISNVSNLDLDHILSGKIQVGTTPTVGQIEIYVVPLVSYISGTAAWPDVMDGTAGAETWQSVGTRNGAAVLAKTIAVDLTTSDLFYWFGGVSVAALFGGFLPEQYELFVTHNTVAALHATDGNHLFYYNRVQGQAV